MASIFCVAQHTRFAIGNFFFRSPFKYFKTKANKNTHAIHYISFCWHLNCIPTEKKYQEKTDWPGEMETATYSL